MSVGVHVAVESWSPGYGSSVGSGDAGDLPPGPGQTTLDAEVAVADWAPMTPAPAPAEAVVRFVDGVQRIDAQVWVTGVDGRTLPGWCVSIAAGSVCCDTRASVAGLEVRRMLLGPVGAPSLTASGVTYEARPLAEPTEDALAVALSGHLRTLENEVARDLTDRREGELLVLDGPLRDRADVRGAIGYVKSHHVGYLDDATAPVLGRLEPGQRTPVFLITTAFSRWSWYVRLPGARPHPLSGIVRCEAATTVDVRDLPALADRVTATLPRFASRAFREPRAPQNLTPIAGLEQQLKHRLGDRYLLERMLRRAAA